MIKQKRQKRILAILNRERTVEVSELSRLMPEVSRVTIRRDIAELAEAGALRRTHGGAVLPDATLLKFPNAETSGPEPRASLLDGIAALVLPPIPGRGGEALRRRIRRRAIPFLAESAPQAGGVYLGPDNRLAAMELGCVAGRASHERAALTVLMISQAGLSNTQERAEGFEAGLRQTGPARIDIVRVNGRGNYRSALRVAQDALQANPGISVVFCVNDHSAKAAIDAAARLGREVEVYATGGESADFLAQVAEGSALRGVAAFFPEVVGNVAVDAIAARLSGTPLPDALLTPHAIITRETLEQYYRPLAGEDCGWALREEVLSQLAAGVVPTPARCDLRACIGVMPHYPAHDWYRTLIQAMQDRVMRYGLELAVLPPHQGIADEVALLQREIARAALPLIGQGETVVLGDGAATLRLAEELRSRAFGSAPPGGITVLTNSLDVLYCLDGAPGIKPVLTGGEYQAADHCLVGPSLGAIFDHMLADKAFLTAGGVSPRFGLSAVDERRALAGNRISNAARQTIALADHTLIGSDANHLITRIDQVTMVVTDDGALPADRQALRAAGVEVLVATSGETAPAQPES
ncbi:MAG: substrate-binding domain-containing protein [Tropicimonas sp.]|uniref:substrate-binding domain-containing protein n=1 Tax=Tropicimonas sp. TaxID=2067044 RepID=UPI003A8AB36F